MSYTIDIFEERLEPTNNFIDFALFVSFFPQLVAGPIERARHLLPILSQPRKVIWPSIAVGAELIIIGYFKKVGVADSLAPLVDSRFEYPQEASGADLLLCAYLFSFQIYCDFSGYSDIARGISRLFGIELMRNFNQPYLSRDIIEFWRRWHISLSTWLRDYLYIPLGGNQHGTLKTTRNLMATMLLGGLWHGAAWTFVAWGAIHGAYLIVNRYLRRVECPVRHASLAVARRVVATFVTFNLVTFTWIFFRSDSFKSAADYIRGIFTWQSPSWNAADLAWLSPKLIILVGILVAVDVLQARTGNHAVAAGWSWPLRGLVYGGLIAVTLILGNVDAQVPFIYFQF